MATATATAQAQAQPAMDAREWDEAAYRRGILRERDLSCRTLFRAVFFDQRDDPDPDVLLAAASSDGSLASFSLSSCISSSAPTHAAPQVNTSSSICPVLSVGAMGLATKGTLKMGNLQRDSFVATAAGMMAAFGAGDGTRCRAALCRSLCKGIIWNQYLTWLTLSMKVLGVPALQYRKIMPLQLANRMDLFLQQLVMHVLIAGMWYVFSEESGKCKMTFKGHTDYLHSIAVREANHQVVTGSEDGTARIWDCRSGKCTQTIHPVQNKKFEGSWVGCIAIDASESWLACGTSSGISVWSLLSNECIFNADCSAPVQDLLFDKNQILAVGAEPALSRFTINGAVLSQIKCAPPSAFSVSMHSSGMAAVAGHGGLVDVISAFGSHLCAFRCRGLDK
ncbi:THO complex subunit 6 isoform X5 [Brachypodium distachyon]|uniref:THO complex subunit 6 isoform X5 n=1 Tax=Brachypodium distachyon TaxID=15368 RepID=UPI0006E49C90|nr:THO complex subunit 6 isoform X5 [Brachypodium distachyon]|eukprot:XP_024319264.1 THO complex subunit 6 isoform X5 [Brachypodium distachyon]